MQTPNSILFIGNIIYYIPINNQISAFFTYKIPYIIIVNIIQIIIITILICQIVLYPYKPKYEQTSLLKTASDSTQNMLSYWTPLWLSWFLLYIGLVFVDFQNSADETLKWSSPVLNLVNNISGVFLFSMFYEMHEKTVTQRSSSVNQIYYIVIIFLVIFLLVEVIFLQKSDSEKIENISKIFMTISGLFVGISTGLLVTKFSSLLFRVPLWALMSVVGYSILQPVLPFILDIQSKGENATMRVIFTSLGLYGKFILFIIIHWCRDTDRIFYYMIRAAKLYKEETDENLRKNLMLYVFENEKNDSTKN